MKKVIISLVLVAFVGLAFAGNEETKKETPNTAPVEMVNLEGTVIDFNSGEALTGVEVSIEGTEIKAYTDFDGNFTFESVKPGSYNLIASYISYEKSLIENFKVAEKKNEVEIKLQEEK